MKFSILTVHPELIESFAKIGIVEKSIQRSQIQIEAIDLRKFADAPHFRVDEKPFGGGAGMLLKIEPIVRALRACEVPKAKSLRILVSAKGEPFTQKLAEEFSAYEQIIFVCGRYEGVDQRVSDFYVDREIRVGEAVCMGGEIPSLIMLESIARLVPGVIGNEESLEVESFSEEWRAEYPQYTRPSEYEGHEVPEILLSGDHRKIYEWRRSKIESK
ncbi:MAG: tRNA (guanosine(37)-N1)-methyltransferase TrmD [Deltaproteobacteria bacterium CG11_big_fil_rev_8_21_14_0_20_45_16]|nr:MAG: tRNA (guanosine(37)-N1)-methyltransferase TrmD [Deltaproteobacteria bacterium CG11_big_fil_rev_8_21_14_0_20_45_16]